MNAWTATFTVAELTDAPRRFEHGPLGVLVAVVDGEPRAVSDSCLHKGVSLAGGVCRDGVITCPSHWWRYDLRDGSLQGTPGAGLAVYPARVSDGIIEVQLPEVAPAMSMREMLLAHARGEAPADA
ncbi:MAG: Rieske (2Fe-2S) protein [Candidatus Nanopelagicales bacterium]|jgi:nitrite reductase/ring-hydroxylating ferredoxin subunit